MKKTQRQRWRRPSYLHLGVHAAVDCSSPGVGRTRSNNAIATGGQKRSLVLVEGLQWRVVARGLELEPAAGTDNRLYFAQT